MTEPLSLSVISLIARPSDYDGKKVRVEKVLLVEGTFDATSLGHLGMYSGTIRNVVRLVEWVIAVDRQCQTSRCAAGEFNSRTFLLTPFDVSGPRASGETRNRPARGVTALWEEPREQKRFLKRSRRERAANARA